MYYVNIILGLIILFAIILDIVACYYVVKEDLFYTTMMKLKKIIFIFLVPYIGAIYEIKEVSKFIFEVREGLDFEDNKDIAELID